MNELVAVILARNEAHNIASCVASLRDWVDSVVVWDSGRDAGYRTCCRRMGRGASL